MHGQKKQHYYHFHGDPVHIMLDHMLVLASTCEQLNVYLSLCWSKCSTILSVAIRKKLKFVEMIERKAINLV